MRTTGSRFLRAGGVLLAGLLAGSSAWAAEAPPVPPPTPAEAPVNTPTAPVLSAHLATVVQQFRAYHGAAPATPETLTATQRAGVAYLAKLAPDGSWPDIDYASKQPGNWPVSDHLQRLLALTALLNGQAAQRPAAAAAWHRALGYWRQHDFQCPNWWYNQIGGPKALATMGLLAGEELAPAERAYLVDTVLPRAKIAMTGQNRVWLAENTLMRGLLRGDDQEVAHAAGVIFSEVVVSTAEGLQPDASFHQHGAQLQIGNYGLALASDVAVWTLVLRGTPFAPSAAQVGTLRHFVLDGEAWMLWRGAYDVNGLGRQFSPGVQRNKANALLTAVANLAQVDTAHAADYQAVLTRNQPDQPNDLVGTSCFWRSELLVHRQPGWAMSLHASSARVIGGESLNQENLSGYYQGDGVTCYYRQGDEYDDLFPVWDWRRLPGTTVVQAAGPLPAFHNSQIKSTFVGGAAAGPDGVFACAYQRDGVTGHLAWFCAGDVVVALGSGLAATAADPLATTLNQCRLRGAVQVTTAAGTAEFAPGRRTLDDLQAVEHDGFRYTLLGPGRATLACGPQTGSWRRVLGHAQIPAAEQQQPVFALWLEHGAKPTAASYAYAVTPAGQACPATVLSNTPALQAVAAGTHVLAVFTQAGELATPDGHHVAVDHPCVVLLDFAVNPPRLAVADPTHLLPALTVTVDARRAVLTLPTAGDAGRTVAGTLE